MIKIEELYKVGKIQKTHALKGELNMICDIDPQYFMEGNPLILDYDAIFVPYFIESVRPKGTTSYLVKIDGIDTEEAASQFVNKDIYISKKEAEDLIEDIEEEEDQLIGFQIYDTKTNTLIGRITGIEDSTTNILFIVENENGEEVYIPAVENFIEEIKEGDKIIRMNLPEGLLGINSKE